MKRQSFLKGSAVLLVMVAVTKVLGLVYKVPLTSLIGGGGMSCYSGAFAVFTPVFAAAAAGAPMATSRLVSERLALGCVKDALRIKRTALTAFFTLSLGLSAALILSAGVLAERVIHIPQAKWAIIGIAFMLPPAAVMNVYRGWAEGLGSMNPTASSEIFETAGKLIFGLAGAFAVMKYAENGFAKYHGCFGHYCSDLREVQRIAAPYAAAASAAGVSLASYAACGFIMLRTRHLTREALTEPRSVTLPLTLGRRAAARQIFSFAAPSSLTAVIATLAGIADLLTISPGIERAMSTGENLFAFLGAYGVPQEERAGFVYGSYTALALMIFGLLPSFTAMLGKSILPSLTAACAKNDKPEITQLVRSVLLLSSAISLPGGMGIMLLAERLLVLFFGGQAAEIAVSEKPLAVLGAAVIFMGIALPCLTAMQACSKQVQAMVITLAGTAVKLVLNIILIPLPGLNISGAAVSTAVSQAIICAAAVTCLVRGTGAELSCVKALFMPLLPALLCSCAAVLTQRVLVVRFEGVLARVGVLFSVAVGSIVCFTAFVLLCISPKNEIFGFFSKKITKTP